MTTRIPCPTCSGPTTTVYSTRNRDRRRVVGVVCEVHGFRETAEERARFAEWKMDGGAR